MQLKQLVPCVVIFAATALTTQQPCITPAERNFIYQHEMRTLQSIERTNMPVSEYTQVVQRADSVVRILGRVGD
jgi:hypothetical protein